MHLSIDGKSLQRDRSRRSNERVERNTSLAAEVGGGEGGKGGRRLAGRGAWRLAGRGAWRLAGRDGRGGGSTDGDGRATRTQAGAVALVARLQGAVVGRRGD
jgi:hypothetical protein